MPKFKSSQHNMKILTIMGITMNMMKDEKNKL